MSDDVVSDDVVIERPRVAASKLGFSLATFWRRVKEDPDFPKLVRLGPNSVGLIQAERVAMRAS